MPCVHSTPRRAALHFSACGTLLATQLTVLRRVWGRTRFLSGLALHTTPRDAGCDAILRGGVPDRPARPGGAAPRSRYHQESNLSVMEAPTGVTQIIY